MYDFNFFGDIMSYRAEADGGIIYRTGQGPEHAVSKLLLHLETMMFGAETQRIQVLEIPSNRVVFMGTPREAYLWLEGSETYARPSARWLR